MGFGSFIGGVVGFVVGGPPGAAIGAGLGGTKAGEAVVKAAGNAIGSAADTAVEVVGGFGEVIWVGATAVVDAVGDVAKGLYNLVHGTIAFRSLRASERTVLLQVYGGSVDLDKIVVSSIIGVGNRPFTLPGNMIASYQFLVPGIGTALSIYSIARGLSDKFVLCLGMEGYNHGLSMPFDGVRGGQTLVHEVAHVWQGTTGAWSWAYVIESITKQCACGLRGIDAYSATAGLQFHEYNVEQQARLIETWYTGAGTERRKIGMAIPNADAMKILDLYINEIVRTKNPKGNVTIPATTNVGTTSSGLTRMTDPFLGGALSRVVGGAGLSPAQKAAYKAQAEAWLTQARALRATGNPVLLVQAAQLEAQAAQLKALYDPVLSVGRSFSTSPMSRFSRT